jgi:hypothetical protein
VRQYGVALLLTLSVVEPVQGYKRRCRHLSGIFFDEIVVTVFGPCESQHRLLDRTVIAASCASGSCFR